LTESTFATVAFITDQVARIAVSLRVIMRRRPYGVTVAWIVLVLFLPIIGAAAYLMVGESRLGIRRVRRENELRGGYLRWLAEVGDRPEDDAGAKSEFEQRLERHATVLTRVRPLRGNVIELFHDAHVVLKEMAAEIDRAKHTVALCSYIWHEPGDAGLVADALCRAASRGVVCRVLLDAHGSAKFLRSKTAARMREAGVRLARALPVHPLLLVFVRADLRNHRKLLVIDNQTAFIGSQNIVDPRYFKKSAGVGAWIDSVARVRGPSVEPMVGSFLFDWEVETGEPIFDRPGKHDLDLPNREAAAGEGAVQYIPSGPGLQAGAFLKVLVGAVYEARDELKLVTPYFVPDETLRAALLAAAQRGVRTTLIVPRKLDNRIADRAARSYLGELADAGVRVMLYRGGLLHSKIVVVDQSCVMIGTCNLDLRSFWLNFEAMLAVYDGAFAARSAALLQEYEAGSDLIDAKAWAARPLRTRLSESAAQLLAPLL
jgi:cardiolipin synthase